MKNKSIDNIVLIGMPGSGKSTIGVLLAKSLMYSFCDTDLAIQSDAGHRLYEIIDNDGIDAFLETENRIIASMPPLHRTVIATGGSAVYGKEAMKHLGESGVIVYLSLPCGEIEHRVNNITTRGIAMKKGETLRDIYEKRTPLYEKYADVTVNCSERTMEQNVAAIIRRLDEMNK